jgi:site-specific recombinase XerD
MKREANNLFSLDDIYKNYIFTLQIEGKSHKTIKNYQDILSKFISYISTLDNLNLLNIHRYIAELQDKKLSPVSINDYIRVIKIFLNFLYKEEYISENISAKLKKYKIPKQYPYVLNDEQVYNLLKVCNKNTFEGFRNYVIILTFLDTGIRLSELINLTINDVNLIKRSLLIRSGKGDKDREVYMGKELTKAMAQYIKKRGFIPYEDKLFITKSGNSLSPRTIQKIFKKLAKKAHIESTRCSPHTLRHTFATNFIRNGGDVFTLQRILGHSDIETCMIYVHLSGKDIQTAMTKFSPVDKFLY